MPTTAPRLERITLCVPDLNDLADFYAGALGFRVVEQSVDACIFALGPDGAQLEFIRADVVPQDPQPNDFYWKIGLTLRDLDAGLAHLAAVGIPVQPATQFRDIGYMSRITDPHGFQIELLQQGFQGNAAPAGAGHPLAGQSTLAHLTLRITDLPAAQHYFETVLGLRLMSIQPVRDYNFDLYFYGFSAEILPNPDLRSVENREWLWARPYTLIELQHLTATNAAIRKPIPASAGFTGFHINNADASKITLADLAPLT